MRTAQSATLVTEASRFAIELAAELHEPPLAAKVERLLRRCVRDAIRVVEGTAVTAAASEEWVPPVYRVPLPSEMMDEAAVQAQLEDLAREGRAAAAGTTGEHMGEYLETSFEQRNRLLDGVLASQSGMMITTAPAHLLGTIREALQESYDKGESIPHAARRIRKTGYTQARGYAERIARTEIGRASNAASLAAVQHGTTIQYKLWMATNDQRTRPTHRAADGQSVKIDSTFTVGNSQLAYPGDPAGSGEEVILCRCAIGYTDEPNLEKTKGGANAQGGGTDELVGTPPETWDAPAGELAARGRAAVEAGQAVRDRLVRDIENGTAGPGAAERLSALNAYTDFGGELINTYMRGNLSDIPEASALLIGKHSDNLRALFTAPGEHALLEKDTLLFRGITKLQSDTVGPGTIFTERGVASTSASADTAKEFAASRYPAKGEVNVVLRIHAPAETNFIVGIPKEAEIILAPDSEYVIIQRSREQIAIFDEEIAEAMRPYNFGDTITYDAILLRPGETISEVMGRLGLSS